MNVILIVFMIVVVILLFSVMVLSAVASRDATKSAADCQSGCHKYSMWSALVAGLSVAVMVVIVIVYIYASRV